MRCELGYCIVCDKEIASACGTCGVRKPNSDYTEVLLNWSNGSKMSMAVCIDCAPEKVWKADKKEMTEAVWRKWDSMGHAYSKDPVLVD